MKNKMTKLATALLFALSTSTAALAATEDFETFSSGTVNGQGGWTTVDQWGNDAWGNTGPAFDQEIQDDGSTTNNVWRVSNTVTSGALSAIPMSQVSPMVAGETGAALFNDRGPDHTMPLTPPNPGAYATTPYFYASFDFKSATDGPQSGLAISASPTAKQFDGRQTYVQLVDDGVNGFDVFFYETGDTGGPFGANAQFIEVASDLSYDEYHNVEIAMQFVDGLDTSGPDTYGNDIVTIYVNGVPVHTGSSWETHYAGNAPFGTSSTDKHAVDALGFRISGTAQPALDGGGFYFDNVEVSNAAAVIPEPASFGMLALGGLALIRRRKLA